MTTPSADAFGGARSVEVTFPYESVTLYSNVIAEKSFKKSNHLLYSFRDGGTIVEANGGKVQLHPRHAMPRSPRDRVGDGLNAEYFAKFELRRTISTTVRSISAGERGHPTRDAAGANRRHGTGFHGRREIGSVREHFAHL